MEFFHKSIFINFYVFSFDTWTDINTTTIQEDLINKLNSMTLEEKRSTEVL